MSDQQYGPGHPWHYLEEGDGAEPLPVEQIPPARFRSEDWGIKFPKNPKKRRAMITQLLASQQVQLSEDINRYQDLLARGVEATSRYDRKIAYSGDDRMALASSIALIHNHISYSKGRIQWLTDNLGVSSTS